MKECDKEGLAYGEDVTINYTGSRTEPGSSPNTFTVTWDNANEGNYDLTTVFGTLTVTEAAITPGGAEADPPEHNPTQQKQVPLPALVFAV